MDHDLRFIEEPIELTQGQTPEGDADRTAELEKLFEVHYVNPPEPKAEKPKEHVEGFLAPGYINASGPPKLAFKTLFSLALSLHIHTGRDFLGRKVAQANCAWLQLDMAEPDFQDYAERIVRGMGIEHKKMPYLFCSLIDLMDLTHQEALCKKLQDLGTKIFTIDSSRACASLKENESDDVRRLVRKFFCAHLRDKLGITVVLISHTPKGGSGARGSGEWVAAADSEWRFVPHENSNMVTIHGMGRHAPFKLTFEFEWPNEDEVRIKEVTEAELKNREAFTAEQIRIAYEILLEHRDGISQHKLLTELRTRGKGIRSEKARQFIDKIQANHQDVGLRTRNVGKGDNVKTYRTLFLLEKGGCSHETGNNPGGLDGKPSCGS